MPAPAGIVHRAATSVWVVEPATRFRPRGCTLFRWFMP